MDTLYLTDEEICQVVFIGQRFLINEGTHPDDLKMALVDRLRANKPVLAGKIGQMDRRQLTNLRRTMLERHCLYS
jgi:hypothetical protein